MPQRLKLLLGSWRLFSHIRCCIASSCCLRSSSAVSASSLDDVCTALVGDRLRDVFVAPFEDCRPER